MGSVCQLFHLIKNNFNLSEQKIPSKVLCSSKIHVQYMLDAYHHVATLYSSEESAFRLDPSLYQLFTFELLSITSSIIQCQSHLVAQTASYFSDLPGAPSLMAILNIGLSHFAVY